jgi:hypothetical protein
MGVFTAAWLRVPMRSLARRRINLEAKLELMKASLAGRELRRWLHPHPRVTAVAKKTATAAPLALSRN